MEQIISKAIKYVETIFMNEFTGHDVEHTLRVYRLATTLAIKEEADIEIVQLAALLHDVDDYKLSKETYKSKKRARDFLYSQKVSEEMIEKICQIIDEVSFKGNDSTIPKTKEGMCVQDADRLDAIGAIGIARALTYGGAHHRKLYSPDIKPVLNMDEQTYRNHVSTTINHFYEKLFLLKDMMNTEAAKVIAVHRHRVMEAYIEEFLQEWDGKC